MRHWLRALRNLADVTPRRTSAGTDELRTFVAVGYPKVGNTWLRLTLGRYLYELYGLADTPLMDVAEFATLSEKGCKAIGDFTHAPLEWTTQTASNLTYDNVISPFRKLKVIFLTRYPLDTLVSFYKHERYQNARSSYTGSLTEFIDHPVFGLDKLLMFHRLWARGKDEVAQFHLWRYEDALADPLQQLVRVLEFLDEPVHSDMVERAVAFASFDNMKAMELSRTQPVYKSSGFRIFATGDRSNPDALHVRKGKAGGYRDEIGPARVKELENRVLVGMPDYFGYN